MGFNLSRKTGGCSVESRVQRVRQRAQAWHNHQRERAHNDLQVIVRDGQVRLDWSGTPLDIFLDTTEIHTQAARCVSWERFAGHSLPFLSCFHVALFKAFFNRTKDWADLEAMRDAGTLDVERVRAVLIQYLGDDDERLAPLAALAD